MCTGKQMKVKPIQGQSLFVEQQCCGSGSGPFCRILIRSNIPDLDPDPDPAPAPTPTPTPTSTSTRL